MNTYIIHSELKEDDLFELIQWYEESMKKITFSNSDYMDFKSVESNNNKIAELKKMIEVKEDENRELNAIIDRMDENNQILTDKINSLKIIINTLANNIYEKRN